MYKKNIYITYQHCGRCQYSTGDKRHWNADAFSPQPVMNYGRGFPCAVLGRESLSLVLCVFCIVLSWMFFVVVVVFICAQFGNWGRCAWGLSGNVNGLDCRCRWPVC